MSPEFTTSGCRDFRSYTQQRAAYAAANLARGSSDEKTRQLSRELFVRLVQSPQQTNQTYKARFVLAKDLILLEGRREEGLALLRSMPAAAGDWKALADYYVTKYVEQWRHEAKEATR